MNLISYWKKILIYFLNIIQFFTVKNLFCILSFYEILLGICYRHFSLEMLRKNSFDVAKSILHFLRYYNVPKLKFLPLKHIYIVLYCYFLRNIPHLRYFALHYYYFQSVLCFDSILFSQYRNNANSLENENIYNRFLNNKNNKRITSCVFLIDVFLLAIQFYLSLASWCIFTRIAWENRCFLWIFHMVIHNQSIFLPIDYLYTEWRCKNGIIRLNCTFFFKQYQSSYRYLLIHASENSTRWVRQVIKRYLGNAHSVISIKGIYHTLKQFCNMK